MWHIQKIDPLKLISNFKCISFIGSGGKTTITELLARESIKSGRTTAITTTTKIYAVEPYVLIESGYVDKNLGDVVRIGKAISGAKLTGLDFDEIDRLRDVFDVILVEADGAKGKPLKFPASYEPVIPLSSEMTYILCGLDSVCGRVDETVFRWELFKNATGIDGAACVTGSVLLRFFSNDILLKGVDVKRCAVILNKYDALKNRSSAFGLAKAIIMKTQIESVVVASAFFGIFYMVKKV